MRAPTNGEIIAAEFTATTEPLLRPDQADPKYEEASAVAVNACAEDTKGQACWICFDDGSKEGLVRGCSCRGGAGFAHLSCLAKQAKILVAEAEENNLDFKVWNERWRRWDKCRLCEQQYHGVVRCALGWACWKTYVGRPEEDRSRQRAMNRLGNGLSDAKHHEDALSVREAELSMLRRLGASEGAMLCVQGNLANTYDFLRRHQDAMRMSQDVYYGRLKLNGEENTSTLLAANNYALSLVRLQRFEEARSLLRKMMPVARRVLGDNHKTTLGLRTQYADALWEDPGATLDDLREAVTTLEDIERIVRRVFGDAHPLTRSIDYDLREARDTLRAGHFHFPRGARVS